MSWNGFVRKKTDHLTHTRSNRHIRKQLAEQDQHEISRMRRCAHKHTDDMPDNFKLERVSQLLSNVSGTYYKIWGEGKIL